VDTELLEPADMSAIKSILKTCSQKTLLDTRDKAILLFLVDTGLRASEFVALDLADCYYASGAVTVDRGKGGRPRTVFFGRKTRRAVRAYLRLRDDKSPALWVTDEGTRLAYQGLRSMVLRRARRANVESGPHSIASVVSLPFSAFATAWTYSRCRRQWDMLT